MALAMVFYSSWDSLSLSGCFLLNLETLFCVTMTMRQRRDITVDCVHEVVTDPTGNIVKMVKGGSFSPGPNVSAPRKAVLGKSPMGAPALKSSQQWVL
jgi:hypothetical protein